MATMINKKVPLGATSLTLNGLRRMWKELADVVKEQGEIEIATMVRREDQSPDEFEAQKNSFRRDVFKILGTVEFEDGVVAHDSDPDIVRIDEGGPRIRLVYISNIATYQNVTGVKPSHSFEVVVDLRSPPLFDASSVVSAPTPNDTILNISGNRPGWQAGVEAVVRRNIARRRPIRTWFHGGMIYDLFLFVGALPLALYACWALAPSVDKLFGSTNPVLIGAVYLYISFGVLWVYRFMFSYAKWAFPFTEITDQKSSPTRHRAIWWSLILVLLLKPLSNIVGGIIASAVGGGP